MWQAHWPHLMHEVKQVNLCAINEGEQCDTNESNKWGRVGMRLTSGGHLQKSDEKELPPKKIDEGRMRSSWKNSRQAPKSGLALKASLLQKVRRLLRVKGEEKDGAEEWKQRQRCLCSGQLWLWVHHWRGKGGICRFYLSFLTKNIIVSLGLDERGRSSSAPFQNQWRLVAGKHSFF